MRIACLSDIHLGYRAFPATEGGRNIREMDVEKAWFAAVDQIVEYRPHLVTIAGDVFHHPGVSDFAKAAFLNGVRRLLKVSPVIVLQGNHDAGKTAAVLTPIALAGVLGVNLFVLTTPKRIQVQVFEDATTSKLVSVACFPYVARGDGQGYELEPDPTADVNILLMHAAVKSMPVTMSDGSVIEQSLPWFYSGDRAIDVGREAERWDVVALGDFHEYRLFNVEGRVFYSGSLERTSSNIWDEHQPKGWVSVDTDKTGSVGVDFHEVPTRSMADWDLGDFDHPPGAPVSAVNECLKMFASDPSSLEGKIIRFKIDDFARDEFALIDWATVREIQRKALHFFPDFRYRKRRDKVEAGEHGVRRSATLMETLAAFLDGQDPEVANLVTDYVSEASPAEVA